MDSLGVLESLGAYLKDPMTAGIITAAATILAPILLNEYFKRRSSMNEKLWDIKYRELRQLLTSLWDLGDLMVVSVNMGTGNSANFSQPQKSLPETMFHWQGLNSKYYGGKARLLSLGESQGWDLDSGGLEKANQEIIVRLGFLMSRIGNDTDKSVSALKLVLVDLSILRTAQDVMEQSSEVYRRSSRRQPVDLEEELNRFQAKIREFTNRSRIELERTRTWKGIRLREDPHRKSEMLALEVTS